MVLFPTVRNLPDSPQYHLVKRFLTVPYWQPEYADLFAENIVVDLPYAPPGMPQHLIPFEFKIYCHWLRETLRDWENTAEPAIIPTTDPDLFWAIRWGTGKSHWAKRDGIYTAELVYRIELRDGKIQSFREYANPIAFYEAIDVVLPNFNYLLDCAAEAECVRMGPGQASHFTPGENLKRAVANFADPINGHDEDPEPIYADDLVAVSYTHLDVYKRQNREEQGFSLGRSCLHGRLMRGASIHTNSHRPHPAGAAPGKCGPPPPGIPSGRWFFAGPFGTCPGGQTAK